MNKMKRITIIIFGLIIALVALLIAFKIERKNSVQSVIDELTKTEISAASIR